MVYRARDGRKITGYVNTLFSRGAVRIADWAGKELYSGAGVNRLQKVQNADSILWEVKRRFLPRINSGVSTP